MASYLITGRAAGGSAVLSVHIDAINQDDPVVPEMDVVNAMKEYVRSVPGVAGIQTQKTESVTTLV
jgi:hypothetical protein